MKQKQIRFNILTLSVIIFLLIFLLIHSLHVKAQPTHTSPSYGVTEVQIGSGGSNDLNSANFNARAGLGDTVIGNTSSNLYQAYGGFVTTDEPFLEIFVPDEAINFGILTTGVGQSKATTQPFKVRSWQAGGYTLINGSDGPKYNNFSLATLSTPTAFNANQEQFGINLTTNTSPQIAGNNPVNTTIPGVVGSGASAPDYSVPNFYKYVKGDVIASSASSSSITEYTITYMINTIKSTPGGIYTMNHDIVAIGLF